jgi:hypothetical protein
VFGTQNYRFRNTGGGVRAIIDVNSTGVTAGNLTLYNASNAVTTKLNNAGDSYFNGGNVGIGTTTPGEKLEVVGNISASGGITAHSFTGSFSGGVTGDATGLTGTPNISVGHITASGNISASGEVNIDSAAALFSSKLTISGDAYTTGGWKLGSGATYVGKAYNNSGIYSIEADTNRDIQFGDAGTPAVMYIDNSTEKVGIGTTTPAQLLHVYGGAATIEIDSTTNESVLNFDNSVTTANIKLANGDLKAELGGSEVLRISSSGNVGIGTATPDASLNIKGSGNDSNTTSLKIVDSDNASLLYVRNDGIVSVGRGYFYVNNSNGMYSDGKIRARAGITDDQGPLLLGNNDAVDAMTISSSKVGIGTTTPSAKLHVSGSDATDSSIRQSRAGVKIWDQAIDSSGRLQWGYRSSEGGSRTTTFTLDDNNNVGIGTGAPSAKLHVDGDAIITGTLTAQEFHTEFVSASIIFSSGSTKFGDSSDDIHQFSGSLRVTGSGDHYFTDGNVGIGTTTPTHKLDVNGNMIADGYNVGNTSNYIDIATGLRLRSDSNGIRLMPNGTDAGYIKHTGVSFTLPITASGNISSSGTITGNSLVGTVGTATQGTIDIHSLSGYVANEHLDWTTDLGATNIHSGNYTDTTYSVGDGGLTTNDFTDEDHTKLNGIEASADVTDATNVTAAGALMDSELISIADVKALNQSLTTTATPTFGTLTTTNGTIFGEEGGTHQFTGNITASNNISASGTIIAPTINATNYFDSTSTYHLLTVDGTTLRIGQDSITSNISAVPLNVLGHITASGNISASGTITSLASTTTNLTVGSRIYTTIGAGTGNSVVLNSGGQLYTDEIDAGVWGAAGAVVTAEGEVVAPTATLASTSTLVATTDNAEFFVTLVDGASGAQALETSTKLKQNPSTGKLTVTGDVSASGTIVGSNLSGTNTGDQSTSDVLTLIEDGVDSVHYKDGSIDTIHIGDDQVTFAKALGVTPNVYGNYIKLLPNDFETSGDGGNTKFGTAFDKTAGATYGMRTSDSTQEVFAFVSIPEGMKATHVEIYGKREKDVEVFEVQINATTVVSKGTGTCTIPGGSPNVIPITNVSSTATNLLAIEVLTNSATADRIYGGRVTIATI